VTFEISGFSKLRTKV